MKKILLLLLSVFLLSSVLYSCKKEEVKEYKKGTSTSSTYESEYLDLKFKLPEGYTLATEDALKKMVKQGGEVAGFNSDALDSAMETTVYEMQALSSTGNPNVMLMAEKLSAGVTLDTYINALKKQLTDLTTIKYNISSEKSKKTIAGKEYTVLTATASYNGVSMTQEYYCRIQDDRAITFAFTYTDDTADQKDTLLSAFTTYSAE